jgi:hypothetical protein
VIEVILHAELTTDDLRDPPRCPDLSSEAERLGPTCQQHRQLGDLLCRQPRRRPRRRAVPQCRTATLSATADPLTDCTLTHPKRSRNGALLPALLLQLPGAQPSPLAPVLIDRSSSSHVVRPCTLRAFSSSPGDL